MLKVKAISWRSKREVFAFRSIPGWWWGGGYVCPGMVLKFGRARLNHVLSTISTISQKTTGLIETKHLSFFQIDWAIAYRCIVFIFRFFSGSKNFNKLEIRECIYYKAVNIYPPPPRLIFFPQGKIAKISANIA